jgi:hypothetical protein
MTVLVTVLVTVVTVIAVRSFVEEIVKTGTVTRQKTLDISRACNSLKTTLNIPD